MTKYVWNRGYSAVVPVVDMQDGPNDSPLPRNCFIQGGDHSFSELNVDLSKVGHVFALNCDVVHPRVTGVPIGMDYHTIARGGGWREPKQSPEEQEYRLHEILAGLLPTQNRRQRIFADFQHSDTMHAGFNRAAQWGEDRASIFAQINATGLVDSGPFMRRSDMWRKKGEYAFSVSPHGNGYDCHRTWEDLILGMIVIVKTSPIDHLYDGLPVVIVRSWDEITPANLAIWRIKFGDAFGNSAYRERLTMQWWNDKIWRTVQSTAA